MLSARNTLALLAAKAAGGVLRLLGRNGGTWPGHLALKVSPGLLGALTEGVEVAVVTGTNGKTTTSTLLAQVLGAQGRDVLTNATGANLQSGITGAFAANATLAGTPKKTTAVIECDEATLRRVAGALRPKVIVVTNVFRDQLDRYGEINTIVELLREGIQAAPDAALCLNADCSLTVSLADGAGEVHFYGLGATALTCENAGTAPAGSAAPAPEPVPQEATGCRRCGTPYTYTYRTFGHLGGFCCPTCGYARPATQVEATRIQPDASGSRVDVATAWPGAAAGALQLTVPLPATYNVYNALAALTAAACMGVPMQGSADALARATGSFGRMETFTCDGTPVRMILVKNPAGMDQVLQYLKQTGAYSRLVFGLNDKDADGEDISWIWDADFEAFFGGTADPALDILTFGTRWPELNLRMKYAGAPTAAIRGVDQQSGVVDFITASTQPVCLLLNYTTMYELRSLLGRRFNLRQMR